MVETTIDSHAAIGDNVSRFATVFSSNPCARMPYDQVLFEIDGCVIAPTLGSILPYWLLVIPKAPFLNFSRWRSETSIDPRKLVSDVLVKSTVNGDRAFWFEHGPSVRGSSLACGVDHAHLHIIIDAPFSFDDFASAAMNASSIIWRDQPASEAHESIRDGASYLFAASMTRAIIAENVDCVGSQFFRRVIANLVGKPLAWNYKTHPHVGNSQKTVKAFGNDASRPIAR